MADLTLTLKYDNEPPVHTRGARTVLDVAGNMLRLLAEVEREATGKPPQIIWDMNVYSLSECQAAGVACWVKQDSAFRASQQGRLPADVWTVKEMPGGE